MSANVYIFEKLMFEQVQRRQRKIEQEYLLESLPKSRHSLIQDMIGSLGRGFVALSTKTKQTERSYKNSYEGGRTDLERMHYL